VANREVVLMKEVSKKEFKKMYFKYGSIVNGWDKKYWKKFFAPIKDKDIIFKIEEPESDNHDRMMIVSEKREHRLFFLTEESEESFFDFPGKE